jgi:hypothetical protein
LAVLWIGSDKIILQVRACRKFFRFFMLSPFLSWECNSTVAAVIGRGQEFGISQSHLRRNWIVSVFIPRYIVFEMLCLEHDSRIWTWSILQRQVVTLYSSALKFMAKAKSYTKVMKQPRRNRQYVSLPRRSSPSLSSFAKLLYKANS